VAGARQRPQLSGYYRMAATAVALAERGGALGGGAAAEPGGPAQQLGTFGQVCRSAPVG
jgi:hypothetical protein